MKRISPATQRLVFAMGLIGDYCQPHPTYTARYRAMKVREWVDEALAAAASCDVLCAEDSKLGWRVINLLAKANAIAFDALAHMDAEAAA